MKPLSKSIASITKSIASITKSIPTSIYPFLLAALGTVLVLGLTFLVARTCTFSLQPFEARWRRMPGRGVEDADPMEEAVA